MIGRLNHVAIAVPDLEAAAAIYRATLGAKVSEPQAEPDHGVTVIFVELPNTKIELLHPLGANSPIKAFLLDQKRVAGVGNIYADEALFRARVHPLRPAHKLTRAQCAAIRDGVIESLLLGLEHKGATIDDFRDPYGVSGTFQDRFLVHTREHEPCPNCGHMLRWETSHERCDGCGYIRPCCEGAPCN